MDRFCDLFLRVCLGLIPVIGICWILAIPDYVGWSLISAQVLAVGLGLAVAAAMLKYPYGENPRLLELLLAITGFLVWFWMAYKFEDWLFDMADRTPDMWGPGIVAIILLLEGLRKAAGKVIAMLVWVLIGYAYFGDLLPGVLEAEVFPPTKTILYLYADNNGVTGIVLRIVTELVLAFVIFGKMLEVSGASKFFNDLALSWMGHRRGGPAKVAVVASGAFGSISGSTIANIMSTGVVTIPLMKKAGFEARYAAAIEAVASNGGQIAPPVMGATAFIIAEFLEIPYVDVVIAASIPAALYFLILFFQVDAISVRFGIKGLPKSELPEFLRTLMSGWVYLIPIGVLLYFLMGLGYNAGISGLYACGVLFVLMIARNRRLPRWEEWHGFFVGGGENLVPLLLIGGAAGVIIGVLNSTGLAFQLSLVLTTVGMKAGIFVMLLLTAVICIILGMGMPTAAVYIVLVAVIAPALIEMGLLPIAAHMFIFYFGLLSMLTPPVAIASMVAAEMAGSDMWRTGFVALQLAVAAYLMPFLWVFNPALLFEGSWQAIVIVTITCLVAGALIGQTVIAAGRDGFAGVIGAAGLFMAALAIGSATLWIAPDSALTLVPAGAGIVMLYMLRAGRMRKALQPQKA